MKTIICFLAVLVSAAYGAKVCSDSSQCQPGECCQILREYIVASKRDLVSTTTSPNKYGTCQPYKKEGESCASYDTFNGFCGCEPGTACGRARLPTTTTTRFDTPTTFVPPTSGAPNAWKFRETTTGNPWRFWTTRSWARNHLTPRRTTTGNPWRFRDTTRNPWRFRDTTGHHWRFSDTTRNPWRFSDTTRNPWGFRDTTRNPWGFRDTTRNPWRFRDTTGNPWRLWVTRHWARNTWGYRHSSPGHSSGIRDTTIPNSWRFRTASTHEPKTTRSYSDSTIAHLSRVGRTIGVPEPGFAYEYTCLRTY